MNQQYKEESVDFDSDQEEWVWTREDGSEYRNKSWKKICSYIDGVLKKKVKPVEAWHQESWHNEDFDLVMVTTVGQNGAVWYKGPNDSRAHKATFSHQLHTFFIDTPHNRAILKKDKELRAAKEKLDADIEKNKDRLVPVTLKDLGIEEDE